MNINKILSLLLVICLGASTAACGGGADGKTTDPAAPATSSAAESSPADTAPTGSAELSGKLSIWSWGAGAEKDAREEAVNIFIKQHPELDVEHIVLPTADSIWDQKSTAALAAGNAGDVMQMSPDYYGKMTEYYEDLNPYVEAENLDLESVVTAGLMDGYYRPNGKLEALPLLANCFVFAYNKTLFDAKGVEYPTDDWTWDDFAAMAPQFVEGEGADKTYFFVNHWVNPDFALISKGGEPYTADLKTALVDSPEVAAGLDLFGQLVKEEAMPNDVAAKNLPKEQLFVSGKAAIYPMGGFEIGEVKESIGENFEWGAVLPPKDTKNNKNTNITYGTGYAMNVAAKNKDAAWQFMKEVSFENDDLAKVTAKIGMPGNKVVAENEYASTTHGPVSNLLYIKGMETSQLNLWGGAIASAGDQWGQMWESVTINGATGAEAQAEYFPLVEQAFEELQLES